MESIIDYIGLLAIPALILSFYNNRVLSKKGKKVDNHSEILRGSEK